MSRRYVHVPRPTERAAIAAADRTARPTPPAAVLWDGLLTAYALRDRRGLQRFGLAIIRATHPEVTR